MKAASIADLDLVFWSICFIAWAFAAPHFQQPVRNVCASVKLRIFGTTPSVAWSASVKVTDGRKQFDCAEVYASSETN